MLSLLVTYSDKHNRSKSRVFVVLASFSPFILLVEKVGKRSENAEIDDFDQ